MAYSRMKTLGLILFNRANEELFNLRTELEYLEREIGTKEKKLIRIETKIQNKKKSLKENKIILKEDKYAKENLKLKQDLKESEYRSKDFETKLTKLVSLIRVKQKEATKVVPTLDDNEGLREIKQKYPTFPSSHLERIEIERTIARYLMKNDNDGFSRSQILQILDDLYSKYIKPNDRIILLNEIKSWIERDPLCKLVKSVDRVQYYTFI